MKVCSFYPSREAAEEFAEGLREKGAEGVEVGKKTSAGYPVTSVVPDTMREEVEMRQKSHLPKPTEDYAFETTLEPVSSTMAVYEMAGTTPQKTKEDIIEIAREVLRKVHLEDVKVRVSTYQGGDPEAPYADATWFKRRGKFYINIHPIHQYYSNDYTREVVQHEIEHILEKK